MKPSSHSLTLNTSSLIQYVVIAFTTKTTLVKILLALPRLQNVKATFITLTFSLRKKNKLLYMLQFTLPLVFISIPIHVMH